MKFWAGIIGGAALALCAPANAVAGSGATLQGGVQEYTPTGPVPSQNTNVKALRQPGNGQEANVLTTAAGSYSANVDFGEYHVVFSKAGFDEQCRSATAVSGQTTVVPTPTLFPTGSAASASGTLTDSQTGDPIQGVTVEVNFPDSCGPPVPSTLTDASGEYSFASVPAGDYYFTFSLAGYNSKTIDDVVVFGPEPTVVDTALVAVDSTPPKVTIKEIKVDGRKAKVKFSGKDLAPGTEPITFTCKIDKKAAKPCEPPRAEFKNLAKGKHRVTVKATDGNGNAASAKRRFKVK